MEWWNSAFRGTEVAVALAALWTVESIWPMFVNRRARAAHYAGNIALGVINAVIASAISATLLLYATNAAFANDFGLLRWLGLSGWAAWAAALLLFDAWQYFWHRLNHKSPFLWRFHSVHHSDGEMDASTALRFHAGEGALSSCARMAVLPLLGMELAHLAAYELVLLPVILFHHSNLRCPGWIDRALRFAIVTPRMHWVHHSDLRAETDSNYSSVLSVWDRLFRTFQLRTRPEEIRFGLEDFTEREWRGTVAALKIPFAHRFPKRSKSKQ